MPIFTFSRRRSGYLRWCSVFAFIGLIQCSEALGQTPEEEEAGRQVEQSDLEEASGDYTEYLDLLAYYRLHPIDLNKAQAEEFRKLMFLTPLQIAALIRYRESNGRITAAEELQAVEGFDRETIRRLIPFVRVYPELLDRETSLFKGARHRLTFTGGTVLQSRRGYEPFDSLGNTKYAGPPMQGILRLRSYFSRNLSAALTLAKDPGELWWNRQLPQRIDFLSGSVFYKGRGLLKHIVLGDYSMQAGQGLIMAPGFSLGKGASITTLARQEAGLRAYTSSNEDRFLRGAAVTFNSSRFDVSAFFSRKSLDASVYRDSTGMSVKTFVRSGLHRTGSELDNRNRFTESLAGAALKYELRDFRVAALIYHSKFSLPFAAGKQEYEKYHFADQYVNNASVNYSYTWKRVYFFGESASSLSAGSAHIHGLIIPLTAWMSYIGVYRNYQKNFYSFYFQALSEASSGTAEHGLLNGLSLKLKKYTDLFFYADLFRFPWLRYGVDAPSSGFEVFGQVSHSFSGVSRLLFRARIKGKQENTDDKDSESILQNVTRSNLRAEWQYPCGLLTMKSRAEWCVYRSAAKPEHGFLVFQDVSVRKLGGIIDSGLRILYFNTDSYNSAVYAMESNLLYAYSIPVFHYKGYRVLYNLRAAISRRLSLALRYSSTRYLNRESVGSGNDEIKGSVRSDLFGQLNISF